MGGGGANKKEKPHKLLILLAGIEECLLPCRGHQLDTVLKCDCLIGGMVLVRAAELHLWDCLRVQCLNRPNLRYLIYLLLKGITKPEEGKLVCNLFILQHTTAQVFDLWND